LIEKILVLSIDCNGAPSVKIFCNVCSHDRFDEYDGLWSLDEDIGALFGLHFLLQDLKEGKVT